MKVSSTPQPVNKVEQQEGQGSVWNTNNYFWEEKDYNKWGIDRLKELFSCIKTPVGTGILSIEDFESFKGECGISIRKGKKIVSYDYEIKLKWKIPLKDAADTIKSTLEGEFEFADVNNMVEDEGEEFEIFTTYKKGGEFRDEVHSDITSKGYEALRGCILTLSKELRDK